MRLLGLLSSMQLAAVLLAVVAVVIAIATAYEARYGRVPAAVMIYQSWWFGILFSLLAINIFGAAAIRYPWHRRQTGFVLTHIGMLMLMASFVIPDRQHLDGMLIVGEGTSNSRITLPTDYLSVSLQNTHQQYSIQPIPQAGYPSFWRYCLSPVWTLPALVAPTKEQPPAALGEVATVPLRIAAAVDHAEREMIWEQESNLIPNRPTPPAAVAWQLTAQPPGSDQPLIQQGWLTTGKAEQRRMTIGPLHVRIDACDHDLYAEDFQKGPATLPDHGQLIIYTALGKITLPAISGETALLPTGAVRVIDQGQDDKGHPVCRFQYNGEKFTAHAADPQLHQQRGSAIQTVFLHPAANDVANASAALVDIVITPNRTWLRQRRQNSQQVTVTEVTTNEDLRLFPEAAMPISFKLLHAFATARPAPQPVAVIPSKQNDTVRFLALEAFVDGIWRRTWVMRGTQAFLPLDEHRQLGIHYAREVFDLEKEIDLSLTLERFHHDRDQGGRQSAAFSSAVLARHGGTEQRHVISMNQPLQLAGITAYQSGYSRQSDGSYRSHLTISRDPARALKYLGSFVMVAGIVTLYLMRRRPHRSSLT